jgi:hypothetical protein
MGKVALACVGVALVVAVVVIALGGGTSADERDPLKASAAESDGSPNLACTDASFSLGGNAGTIDFSLKCDGAGTRRTSRVYIARFSGSRPGLRSDFRAVSAEGEKGRCQLRRGIASCVVPRGEATELRGELRVPPGTECTRAISAYVVLPSRCGNSSACNLEFATKSLFRGPPRNCA